MHINICNMSTLKYINISCLQIHEFIFKVFAPSIHMENFLIMTFDVQVEFYEI